MAKTMIQFYVLLSFMIMATGCATVFGGSKNKLVVENGTPPSAEVYLDGEKIGTAPLNRKIDKYLLQHGSIIELRATGYATDTIVVERKVHPYYALADVFTGGIWMLVDVATGNIYRPATGKIRYELEKDTLTKTGFTYENN